MSRAHRHTVATLIFVVSAPLASFAGLACGGGETKPPESAASEGSASASSEAPAASESASPAESASAAAEPAASPSSESTASSAPSSPPWGGTDCGRCVDKTCAKPMKACEKNTDCSSTLDSIHGCTSGAATCVEAGTPPTAAKPKKLAAAYESCAKKAVTKACKAKCE